MNAALGPSDPPGAAAAAGDCPKTTTSGSSPPPPTALSGPARLPQLARRPLPPSRLSLRIRRAMASQPLAPRPGLWVTDAPELPDIPHGDLIRQATINVAAGVAERFRAYQRQQAAEAAAPSNAEVVFRALEACRGRYAEVVASRRPQAEPGRLFGAPVAGRRVSSEARLSSQINYRPTYAEVAEIKRLAQQAEALSVSAFLDAVLDEFLPPLPGRPRGRGAR